MNILKKLPCSRMSSTYQVSANLTMMFQERGPLITRFRAAKNAGFRFVEVSYPFSEKAEDLAKELEDSHLTQVLINSDPGHVEGGEMGCACIPGKEALFKASIEKTVAYAKALKCKMVHVVCGKRTKAYTEEEHLHTLEGNLQWATDVFAKEQIIGLIEPKNCHTFPGYFLDSFDLAVSLLFKINSPHMRLLLDLFHLQMISGNVTRNIERLMPYVAHIQVSQPPSRHEPLTPGELDFEFVFNKIREEGYKGYIGAEYTPLSNKTEDSLGWVRKCGLTL